MFFKRPSNWEDLPLAASWLKIARPQKSSFNQLNWDSLTCVWTTMAEISNFVQKLWYLFHLKYKLNMIQCNNTGHLLVMKTKNCMLLKVWGISIRSSLIKKAKMHLNYWTKIVNSSHSGRRAAESFSDQTLLESQFSQTQLRIEAWFLRECYFQPSFAGFQFPDQKT